MPAEKIAWTVIGIAWIVTILMIIDDVVADGELTRRLISMFMF